MHQRNSFGRTVPQDIVRENSSNYPDYLVKATFTDDIYTG